MMPSSGVSVDETNSWQEPLDMYEVCGWLCEGVYLWFKSIALSAGVNVLFLGRTFAGVDVTSVDGKRVEDDLGGGCI
jgi:hypothetical protein